MCNIMCIMDVDIDIDSTYGRSKPACRPLFDGFNTEQKIRKSWNSILV